MEPKKFQKLQENWLVKKEKGGQIDRANQAHKALRIIQEEKVRQ